METGDVQLMERLADGDHAALAALYDRYGGVAYGLALRVLRDATVAEDAVQDAFLALWRSADRFLAGRSKPSTWILTLVHRRAVDLVRANERRRCDPLDAEYEAPPAPRVEDELWLLEERRRVRSALSALGAHEQETLELAYYGGLTQSEIAARMEVPLGTVKSRTMQALAKLRHLLAESEDVRELELAWLS